MRFFIFPMMVALVLSGCDKQQQEEVKAPAVTPPVSMSAPLPSPAAPVVLPQAVVPQEAPRPVVAAPAMVVPKTAPGPAIPSIKPDALTLAKQSGCLACHDVDKKIVGPAWKDVSARYKNDTEARARLIAKVKAGGKGSWAEVTGGMPMPPYSPRVSDSNIEILVDFVLSLAR